MVVVVLAMLVIVAAGAMVVTYVAFPSRGRQVPHAPWLGSWLARAAERTGIDHDEERERLSR